MPGGLGGVESIGRVAAGARFALGITSTILCCLPSGARLA